MRHTLLLLALAAAAHAAEVGGDALVAQLTARSPRNRAYRDEKLPARPVVGLVGDLADAGGKPLDTVRAFLATYGSLLGVPAGAKIPGDLVVLHDEKSERGHALVVAPARGGVPYIGGALSFRFGKSGKLTGASGRYRSLDGARGGSLSAAQAARRALEVASEEMPGATLTADGTVSEYFADGDGGLAHVYSVELPLGKARHAFRVLLGPGGEHLRTESAAREYDGTAKIYDAYSETAGGTNGPMKASDLTAVTLTDLVKPADTSLAAPLAGTYFVPQSSSILKAASKTGRYEFEPRLGGEIGLDLGFNDPRFLDANVYHHLMVARKHAIEVARVPQVDVGRALKYDAWKYPDSNNPSSMNNAYYNDASMEFGFALINPKVPMAPPAYIFKTTAFDKSMIYHEYGHHVLNVLMPGIGRANATVGDVYESEAIDEGFADFFAVTILNASTVGGVFGRRRPVGREPAFTKCKLLEDLEAAFAAARAAGQADKFRPSFHKGGELFSAICVDLFNLGLGPNTLPAVCDAMKSTTPRTFEKFALSFQALLHEELNDEQRDALEKLFKDRGVLFATCNFPDTAIARPAP